MNALPDARPPVVPDARPLPRSVFLLLALFVAAYCYAPYAERGPVLCPLHGLAGLPCPGCGMTRAFADLAHGRFGDALAHNALAFPLAAGLVAHALVSSVGLIRARPAAWPDWLFSSRTAFLLGAGVIAYHLARCVRWYGDGTLLNGYVRTSWTYALLSR